MRCKLKTQHHALKQSVERFTKPLAKPTLFYKMRLKANIRCDLTAAGANKRWEKKEWEEIPQVRV